MTLALCRISKASLHDFMVVTPKGRRKPQCQAPGSPRLGDIPQGAGHQPLQPCFPVQSTHTCSTAEGLQDGVCQPALALGQAPAPPPQPHGHTYSSGSLLSRWDLSCPWGRTALTGTSDLHGFLLKGQPHLIIAPPRLLSQAWRLL